MKAVPLRGDSSPSAGTSSPPPLGFFLNTEWSEPWWRSEEDVCTALSLLTFAGLLLGRLPAAMVKARHRLDVAFADRWGVQHQLRGPGQTHGQGGGAHQDSRDP